MSACGGQGSLPPEERGRAAYAAYDCKRCHRIGYEGGDTGPDLTYVGFRKSAAFLELWLKDPGAWQPDTLMPNFHLSDAARGELAAYLATLKGQGYPDGKAPWDDPGLASDSVARGREIYARAGCVTCHGKDGKGGYVNSNVIGGKVPALERASEGFTKKELVDRIAKGVRHPVKADPEGPEPLLHMPAWEEVLSRGEIEAVADYLLSLKPARPSETW